MSTAYDADFFDTLRGSFRSAQRLLPLALDLVQPQTLIDVGCGNGAWARVARDAGCTVVGIDGDWVPRDQLLIEQHEFRPVDLVSPPALDERYDMAVSVEVAEHLPPASAVPFVRFLTKLAPVVLFSGAVPFQRGTSHINERLASYWVDLFRQEGYEAFDVIRPRCWTDRQIDFYYRQNCLIFAAGDNPALTAAADAAAHPIDIIHPDALPILAQGWVEHGGVVGCLRLLRRTIELAVRKRLRR